MDLATLQNRLIRLPPRIKRLIIALADSGILTLVLLLSIALVQRTPWPETLRLTALLLPFVILAGVLLLSRQGLYRAITRFIGLEMVAGIGRAASLLAPGVALGLWLVTDDVSRSLSAALVFWGFAILLLCTGRMAMRLLVSLPSRAGERVAIYGAGSAGLRLATALGGGQGFRPVVFLDDAAEKWGRQVAGFPVCPPADLPVLIAELGIRRVLLALPSVPRHVRQRIINTLTGHQVQVQTMPDIADLVRGRARIDDLREVGVLDILGREQIAPDRSLLERCIRDKAVMVTGAGGSIGSELCRQIIELGPRRMVLFELSEAALYEIEREMRQTALVRGIHVDILAVLGSVHHRERTRSVMSAMDVQTVYHAAAYKHVPLVEHNIVEGVHNNLYGTWYTAEAAEDAGVETFVLVSTDKAVQPVNIMGATKRYAELVLQGMAARGCRTRFCMVRFGNVLNSSGSVVPLFQEQIRRGGPVTVTHPDIIRYFMTIPEAAQLVIQAGSMGQGGDVFVLDMGEPVRIADLAQRMITLAGLTVRDADNPNGDIAIEYTGLRPGEKLYEELLIGTNVGRTRHPMIMHAFEAHTPWPQLQTQLGQLLHAANAFDCAEVRRLLMAHVEGYVPRGDEIHDLVWQATHGTAVEVARGSRKIAVLQPLRHDDGTRLKPDPGPATTGQA